MVMYSPFAQRKMQDQQILQQQMLNQQSQGQQMGNALGGLVGSALAKRNDGKNDSIGNGVRYTNDGSGGAFNEAQIKALQQFAKGGYDTSQSFGSLANTKFTVGGNQYQADRNGLLSMIPQQTPAESVIQAGLTSGIPDGAKSIGLEPNASDIEKWLKTNENSITIG